MEEISARCLFNSIWISKINFDETVLFVFFTYQICFYAPTHRIFCILMEIEYSMHSYLGHYLVCRA